ncbi:MAG: DUF6125 family protein [Deltaproteobacteria bacterium]
MIQFAEMEREELLKYLDFMMWHYRVVDAFWYISLEESYDSKTADHFNEKVWEKAAQLAAGRILKDFEIQERGLEGFLKALRYFPWAIMCEYQVEQKPDELTLWVPECPTQMARLRRDLGEYDCREMHRGEFISFAHAIDPRIMVECVHAPPDPHPPERFCMWRFTIQD